MTDAAEPRPFTTRGLWYFTDRMTADDAGAFAQEVERLGYSTLWLPEAVGRDPFAHIAHLAHHTTTLRFATGIANIFHRHPGMMRQAAATLSEQTRGRFVLGIGVSHAPLVAGLRGLDYSQPLATMRAYLQAMAAAPYMAVPPAAATPVVLAALGPKMLALSAELADGAHPYWTTPDHTAQARAILGPDKYLFVEQKVVLTTDAVAARAAGRQAISRYAGLPNYRNNWLRLGFTDDEIDHSADRFVDALVVWGDADTVNARIAEHTDAGATHVCIQPLHPDGSEGVPHAEALAALAP